LLFYFRYRKLLSRKGVKVERFNAAYAAILALSQNKVDAVVLDSEPAKKYSGTMKQLVIANIPAEEEDYAIAFRKNDKELINKVNAALDKIKSNGEYDKILKKYLVVTSISSLINADGNTHSNITK